MLFPNFDITFGYFDKFYFRIPNRKLVHQVFEELCLLKIRNSLYKTQKLLQKFNVFNFGFLRLKIFRIDGLYRLKLIYFSKISFENILP